jgi:hypothetical protein
VGSSYSADTPPSAEFEVRLCTLPHACAVTSVHTLLALCGYSVARARCAIRATFPTACATAHMGPVYGGTIETSEAGLFCRDEVDRGGSPRFSGMSCLTDHCAPHQNHAPTSHPAYDGVMNAYTAETSRLHTHPSTIVCHPGVHLRPLS